VTPGREETLGVIAPVPATRVHLVPHTHWDREWYKAAEAFRVHLLPLVDEVLARGAPFLLDGQATILDDVVAWAAGLREPLARALQDGWVEAGPWYVLADNSIAGGEALIRNLAMGRETLGRFGAHAPPVLYCPDTFGHPAVGPTLAAGFGLPVAIVWRGYGGRGWPSGDTARWRNPGGDEVLLYHLPPSGYEFGASLPAATDAARDRWHDMHAVLAPRSLSGELLVLNGADHHALAHDACEATEALRTAVHPLPLVQEGLRGFVMRQLEWAARQAIPGVTGELRASPSYVWTLPGTTSSRAHQKRENAQAERLLVHEVEPWLAITRWNGWGGDHGGAALAGLWRLLLQNHPHDTLCGCSIDDVARSMDDRARRVVAGATEQRRTALGTLVRGAAAAAAATVVITNPMPRRRAGVVEAVIDLPLAPVAIGHGSAGRQLPSRAAPPFCVVAERPLPMQLLHAERAFARDEAPDRYPRTSLVERCRVLLWSPDVPPLGGRVCDIEERATRARPPRPVSVRGLWLDNGRLRVWWDPERGLCCASAHGEQHGLLSFESTGERGDLYTHSPIPGALGSASCTRVRCTARGPLRGELRLEFAVHVPARTLFAVDGRHVVHRSATLRLTARIQLDADAAWFRCIIEGENRLDDHRLRVVVQTSCTSDRHRADAALGTVWRSSSPPAPEPGDVEQLPPITPLHRYVSCFDHHTGRGMTVFSDGLAEYEATPAGTIAVTLIRGVGELSRADLPERPGHAGYPARVPFAQCHGPFAAAFAVMPHGAAHDATFATIAAAADDVLLPPTAENIPRALAGWSGPELHGVGLQFAAALPGREVGSMIVRCANVTGARVRGRWSLAGLAHAWRTRLDGHRLGVLTVQGDAVEFEVPACAAATIELARQDPGSATALPTVAGDR
jgi:mannosylglycerate hydrolase